MRSIMVATDASPAGSAALEWAGGLAEALGTELVAVSVLAPGASATDREAELERTGAAVSGRAAGPAWRSDVTEGDPHFVVARMATDENPDLLVMGTTGTGWWPAVHLGHLAHRLAYEAERPVAVVPIRTTVVPCQRVVVGVDGSEGALAAVRWSATIADDLKVGVVAVHAALTPVAAGPGRAIRVEVDQMDVDHSVSVLRDAGVAVTTARVEGDPGGGDRGRGQRRRRSGGDRCPPRLPRRVAPPGQCGVAGPAPRHPPCRRRAAGLVDRWRRFMILRRALLRWA